MGLAGVELHGVIGYTVLAKYRITFDFTKDKLTWVPLDYDPPPLRPAGKGGQGSLEVIGPVMKVLAGFLGITPKFDPVPRGRLGIEIEDRADGVYVTAVLPGSAAAKAGLKAGDRFDRVGEKTVADSAALRKALADQPAASEVSLTLTRGKAEVPVRVTLEDGL
jgi:serine protease DegQ